MPKYWGKQIFAHGRFPEVGKKQKTEETERKKERLNDGNNNGQATHGARKHAWRTQAAWANNCFHTKTFKKHKSGDLELSEQYLKYIF